MLSTRVNERLSDNIIYLHGPLKSLPPCFSELPSHDTCLITILCGTARVLPTNLTDYVLARRPGGGGGLTHSLGVGTNCKTTAPTLRQWTAPGFPMSQFIAPSFHRSSRTAPSNHQLSIFFFVLSYQSILVRVFLNNHNKYKCYLMDNINN